MIRSSFVSAPITTSDPASVSRRTGWAAGLMAIAWLGACEADPPPAAPLCARRFGDAANQSVTDVAVDAAGDFVIVGDNEGALDFGGGALQPGVYVAKFDSSCQHVWSISYPMAWKGETGPLTPGLVRPPDVAVDPAGNVFMVECVRGTVDLGGGPVAHPESGDTVLFALDAGGAHLWSRSFTGCLGGHVAADPTGNVLFAGRADAGTDLGGGPVSGGFVATFSGGGAHLWSRECGDLGVFGVGSDAAGNVIVGGEFSGAIDLGGGPLVSTEERGNVFAAKFGPDGSHVWSRSFATTANPGNGDLRMAVAPSGEIAICGPNFEPGNGMVDFGGGVLGGSAYAAKLDSTGAHVWSRGFGQDAKALRAHAVALDAAGNAAVAGFFRGTLELDGDSIASVGQDGSDAFLGWTNADGSAAWLRRFGDADGQQATAVVVDPLKNIIVAGHGSGIIDLGGGPLPGSPSDVFLAKFEP